MQSDLLAMSAEALPALPAAVLSRDGRYANGAGAAGSDGAAAGRRKLLVQAEFNGGEEVVAAAQGKGLAGETGIAFQKQVEDGLGRHRDLAIKVGELPRNAQAALGQAYLSEVGPLVEAGACAVRLPLVLEQTGVGVKIAELPRVRGSGGIGAVLGVAAVEALGPQAVEGKAAMERALGRLRAPEAEQHSGDQERLSR